MTYFDARTVPPLTPDTVQTILGTLFLPYLGDYNFKDGRTRKAISVSKRDNDANASGLEVVLKSAPSQNSRQQNWGFYLIDRGGAEEHLYWATELIQCHTRRGGFVKIINQNYELKQFSQAYCEIPVGELYKLREELL